MHTTAEVERLFSLVNLTKTKPRNRLKTPTLEALTKVKKNIVGINKVCTYHADIIAKPIITKLGKDNQRFRCETKNQMKVASSSYVYKDYDSKWCTVTIESIESRK